MVANEIKELANQSGEAAQEIVRRIEGIQGSTVAAVGMIEEVSGTIERINESSNITRDSVTQLSNSAGDISQRVQQTNVGAERISESINEVALGAKDVSKNTGEAALGSNDIASMLHSVTEAAAKSIELSPSHIMPSDVICFDET